ncbi:glutathione S-transferase family protein [Sphingomonas oryzagri]|uniref:Glutathione S-transferase N-terminal domain-containing protein n=1 Tax=Sphingomonas oryzagri TaxID=3042314 RepID=A0ABT6MXL8_9SPHN|nr:glutathione S-transferase N-terminal domain-containing protein [Sphingomonas oryzagri]MDH7637732.1 glutathione S-transferase N-terminal domain-containing protein [Sphingomonas oryzagri]
MRLIGMMNSPYVRRVAATLHHVGVGFDHDPVSVFREYDRFERINPVVKAPTMITDDGVVLMDSTLILGYIERELAPHVPLTPDSRVDYERHQRILGLALAGCEKTVQLIYEQTQRPEERRHPPWMARVRQQGTAAFTSLEREIGVTGQWLFGDRLTLADITVAVVWDFALAMMPDLADETQHPKLADFTRFAEQYPALRACART